MPTPGNALNINSVGYVAFDGTSVFNERTFQAGSGINLTNADGSSGNTTITATGSSPNANIMISDDFFNLGGITTGGGVFVSQLPWTLGSASVGSVAATSSHPGIIENGSVAAAGNFLMTLEDSASLGSFVLGGGIIVLNFVFNIVTASNGTNRYVLNIGMADTITAANPVNGCYIQYSDNVNSGNWTFTCVSASSATTTNSAVAATTGWHNAQITINAAASSVSFSVDGVSLGTSIATNIPTTAIAPMINMYRTAGTIAVGSLFVDLFYLSQTLTTPR